MRRAYGGWKRPGSPSSPKPSENPQICPGPHQLVFDEVTDDFVVEVLDGGPADALLYVLLLVAAKGAGMGPGVWAKVPVFLEFELQEDG